MPRGGADESGAPGGMWKGILAGALVVAAAVCTWSFISGRGVTDEDEGLGKGARQKSAVQVSARPRTDEADVGADRRLVGARDAVDRRSGMSAMPSKNGERKFVRENVPAPLPLEEMVPPPQHKPKPAFSTSSEQLLAMVTPSDPSQPVPPLPNLGEDDKADLEKALKNALQATTNDTIGSLQLKANITEQKEEFRQLRDEEGWTFKEYLTALRDKHNEDAQYIAEAHRINEENYSNAQLTDEEYVRQRDIINKGLRERGLPELQSEDDGGFEPADNGQGDLKKNEESEKKE